MENTSEKAYLGNKRGSIINSGNDSKINFDAKIRENIIF